MYSWSSERFCLLEKINSKIYYLFWVGHVLGDVFCSAEAAGGVNIHQGWERAASHLLCCLYYPLKPLPVFHGTLTYPMMVEQVSRLWMNERLVSSGLVSRLSFQRTRGVWLLLSLLDDRCDVVCPKMSVEMRMLRNQKAFLGVQSQVFLYQLQDLLSVGGLIFLWDETHLCGVVSKLL